MLWGRSYGGDILVDSSLANRATEIMVFLGTGEWFGNIALKPSGFFVKHAKWFGKDHTDI